MKIDSPTFVSETTFISASVVYSSGSQKFGNTEDDQHTFVGSITSSGNFELTGANKKISGSSTSTGSFGRTETTTLNLSSMNGNWTNAGITIADLGTITTADINGGTVDGATIGANSHTTIKGTTIDATTDFTIDGLVITADDITNDAALEIQTAAGDITLDPGGNNVLPGSDSADSLGQSGTQWAKLWVDDIDLAGQGSISMGGTAGRIDLDADDDTSIRSAADDVITVEAGGVDILEINATSISGSSISTGSFGSAHIADKVGIGTKAPAAEMHVWSGDISGSTSATASFGRILATTVSASRYEGQIGARYVHTQTLAATTWTINHNFGHQYPNVNVYDSDDQLIHPASAYATNTSNLTVNFNDAVAGIAIVSMGGMGTNQGQAYVHTQEASATNWRVTHSLSEQYPAVTVWDCNEEVIVPQTVKASSNNHMDITFSSGQSGYAHASIGNGLPAVTSANAGKFLKVTSDGQNVEWVVSSASVSGSMSISGSVLPDADNTYDLGSETKRWANLYANDIIAQRYVISSSVTHVTMSAASGSMIFGDSPDDVHRFTGSLSLGTGSANFNSNISYYSIGMPGFLNCSENYYIMHISPIIGLVIHKI